MTSFASRPRVRATSASTFTLALALLGVPAVSGAQETAALSASGAGTTAVVTQAAVADARRAAATPTAAPAASSRAARKSSSERFWIGVGLEGNGLLANDALNSDTDSGRGIGLSLGYGFTPRWSVYSVLSGASMTASDFTGTYALGHFDLGTRIHFGNESGRVRPFVQAALSGRAVTQDFYVGSRAYNVEASGAGVSFGGGLNAHFTPALAFSGAVTWSAGNFSAYKVNGIEVPSDSLGATSARVHLGIVWFPGGRR